MGTRTAWTRALMEYLARNLEVGVTAHEAELMFGTGTGEITPAERLENLAKNGQLRRVREGGRLRYVATGYSVSDHRLALFKGWGRGGPKVASVFQLAGGGR